MVEADDPVSSSAAPGPPRLQNLLQNNMDSSTKWLVQKYGGTSVGKFVTRIADEIIPFVLIFYNDPNAFLTVARAANI